MKIIESIILRNKTAVLCASFLCVASSSSIAADVDVNGNTEHQTIRGFGGHNGVDWIPDLTAGQIDTAFGTGTDQVGLSIMRMRISPLPQRWDNQVPAAKRAKQKGAILFATPWTPPAYMKTNNSLVSGGKLKSEYYDDYATHLLDFANHMSSSGASLYAISIQNEPDWHPDY